MPKYEVWVSREDRPDYLVEVFYEDDDNTAIERGNRIA